jgi:hypothetical protein
MLRGHLLAGTNSERSFDSLEIEEAMAALGVPEDIRNTALAMVQDAHGDVVTATLLVDVLVRAVVPGKQALGIYHHLTEARARGLCVHSKGSHLRQDCLTEHLFNCARCALYDR